MNELISTSGTDWQEVKTYEDITFHKANGMARIAFNLPKSATPSGRRPSTK